MMRVTKIPPEGGRVCTLLGTVSSQWKETRHSAVAKMGMSGGFGVAPTGRMHGAIFSPQHCIP